MTVPAQSFGAFTLADVHHLLASAQFEREIARLLSNDGDDERAAQRVALAADRCDLAGRVLEALLAQENTPFATTPVVEATFSQAQCERLTQLLQLPHVQLAWTHARQLAALDDVELPETIATPTAIGLRYLVLGLDDVIANGLKAPLDRGGLTPTMAAKIEQKRQELLGMLTTLGGCAPSAAPATPPSPGDDRRVRCCGGPWDGWDVVVTPAEERTWLALVGQGSQRRVMLRSNRRADGLPVIPLGGAVVGYYEDTAPNDESGKYRWCPVKAVTNAGPVLAPH